MSKTVVLKHIGCEGPGLWLEYFAEHKIPFDTVELWSGDALPRLDECAALVVLGGPMNVYEEDKHPFLKTEDEFIRAAVKRGVPYIGLCLGGQLLAKAVAARVRQNPVKEIGWFDVSLTADGTKDRLFSGLPAQFRVFQWHGDTFDIPADGVKLASSELCANQAFRVGDNAFGLQFHLEVSPDMVCEWAEEYRAELRSLAAAHLAEQMISEARGRAEENARLARKLFENFFSIAGLLKK